jgi:hypothetical protein
MVRKRRTVEEFEDFFTAYAENVKEEKRVEEEEKKEREKEQLFIAFTSYCQEKDENMEEEEAVDVNKTYKCTVAGPCFGKVYQTKDSLKVHTEKAHGDPVLAAKKLKEKNEMQKKRRNLAKNKSGNDAAALG